MAKWFGLEWGLQLAEEDSECPFRICVAVDIEIDLIWQGLLNSSLDLKNHHSWEKKEGSDGLPLLMNEYMGPGASPRV